MGFKAIVFGPKIPAKGLLILHNDLTYIKDMKQNLCTIPAEVNTDFPEIISVTSLEM